MTELDIGFRGDRNYLHSTDVFATLERYAVETFGTGSWVRQLSFRKLARRQCRLVTVRSENNDDTCAAATLVSPSGEERRVWLEETDGDVSGRQPFDETAITDRLTLSVETAGATLAHHSSFLVIEELVTAVKALNYALYPQIEGSWLFGKLQLRERLPEAPGTLSVHLTKAIDGRFTVCEVNIDDHLIGDIQFIAGDIP